MAAALDAVITVAIPVLLGVVIDRGVLPKRLDSFWGSRRPSPGSPSSTPGSTSSSAGTPRVSARVSSSTCARRCSAHVQKQPIAFFTRAQTGSLVSRLNGDVIGAQQALTSTLVTIVSSTLQLILVLATMFYFSWLVTVIALVLIPMFVIPARLVGRGCSG